MDSSWRPSRIVVFHKQTECRILCEWYPWIDFVRSYLLGGGGDTNAFLTAPFIAYEFLNFYATFFVIIFLSRKIGFLNNLFVPLVLHRNSSFLIHKLDSSRFVCWQEYVWYFHRCQTVRRWKREAKGDGKRKPKLDFFLSLGWYRATRENRVYVRTRSVTPHTTLEHFTSYWIRITGSHVTGCVLHE